jgi:hypothetical protein
MLTFDMVDIFFAASKVVAKVVTARMGGGTNDFLHSDDVRDKND